MNRKTIAGHLWARLFGWALCVVAMAAACGGQTNGPQGGSDGVSHWLKECALDSECSGLDCLCGVCTRQCTSQQTCSDLGAEAVCANVRGPSCPLDGPETVCTLASFGDAGIPIESDGAPPRPSSDSGVPPKSRNDSGSHPPQSDSASTECRPLDAYSDGTRCLALLGHTFTGQTCDPVLCGCSGADCDRIYATAGECHQAHAECLGGSGDPCAPMDYRDSPPILCIGPTRYGWNGVECEPVSCGCRGPDCDKLYATPGDCEQARLECTLPFSPPSCTAHTDCVLDTAQCCVCGEAGPGAVVALHRSALESHREHTCRASGGSCPLDCAMTGFSPTLYPLCDEATCVVRDVTPYAACTTDDDCIVRFKDCCDCGADGSPSGVVAVSDFEGYAAAFCGLAPSTCAGCAGTPLPAGVSARCEQERCVLD